MKNFLVKIKNDQQFRAIFLMSFSAIFNLVYCIFIITVGIINLDPYSISSGIYYLLLGWIEGAIILRKKNVVSMRGYGLLLMLIDLALSAMTFYALFTNAIKPQHTIIMITIALYSFIRIALAVKNFIDARRNLDLTLIIMRSISFSSALVGILSLTMSMLMTFGGEYDQKSTILIGVVGLAVFILNLVIAIYLIINKPDLFQKFKQKGL